jgi:hypothetical protein
MTYGIWGIPVNATPTTLCIPQGPRHGIPDAHHADRRRQSRREGHHSLGLGKSVRRLGAVGPGRCGQVSGCETLRQRSRNRWSSRVRVDPRHVGRPGAGGGTARQVPDQPRRQLTVSRPGSDPRKEVADSSVHEVIATLAENSVLVGDGAAETAASPHRRPASTNPTVNRPRSGSRRPINR